MSLKLKVVYLAALGEQLGLREEYVEPPHSIHTLEQLRHWLMQRPGNWQALANPQLTLALNFEVASPQQLLMDGAEVAFFPPVTGG